MTTGMWQAVINLAMLMAIVINAAWYIAAKFRATVCYWLIAAAIMAASALALGRLLQGPESWVWTWDAVISLVCMLMAWRFRRLKRRKDVPPEGVRVRQSDGTVTECDVFRDEERDRDGCAMWVAVPQGNLILGRSAAVMQIDVLPARTIIELAAWFE